MNQTPTPTKKRTALRKEDYFSPFANKLIQSGYVDQDQLKRALVEVRKSKRPLLQVLEELTQNKLSPELVKQYKQHHLFELKIFYGVDSLDLETEELATEQMTELIENIINIQVCRRYKLLPIKRLDKEPPVILIAMVNPDDLEALDTIKKMLRSKNLGLKQVVITEEDYDKLFQQYYSEDKKRKKVKEAIAQKEKTYNLLYNLIYPTYIDEDLEDLSFIDLGEADNDRVEQLAKEDQPNEAPIVVLVNKILIKALQDGASDIHIEPTKESLNVYIRKDGILNQILTLPKHLIPEVVNRVKIMADLDISVRDCPQQGKIRQVYQWRNVDFRVNSLPSGYGEKICLRILDNSATWLGLDFLISDKATLEKVREIASRPFGLILVTGITGSGKSTSLYSILAERNEPGINIYTLESISEYHLPGSTKVSGYEYKNQTFASILATILLNNPDIIYINKLEDAETAKIAFNAVSKGKLVLAEIDENSINNVFLRLQEWGIQPARIATCVTGIICQGLLRRVCSECRIAYQPTKEELARFGLTATCDQSITLYKANTLTPEQLEEANADGTVCRKCKGLGYKGRVGVYEFMVMSEALKKLINAGVNTNVIKEKAIEEGMLTILAYSLMLVREGSTTLEEVERVFSDLIEENLAINNIKNNANQKSLDGKIQAIEEQLNNLIAMFELLKMDIY